MIHSNYVPAQVDRHLETIVFTSSGDLILGASSLTGRYWTGSLWYYREPEKAPDPGLSLTGTDIESGTSVG